MESKYYTPDISEFHIGFEYEVIEKCSIEGGPKMLQWNKKTLTSFGEGKFNWHIKNYPDEFRVKCLEKEDIISLGAVCIRESSSPTFCCGNHYWLDDTYEIHHIPEDNMIGISKILENPPDGFAKYVRLFKGTIKNKSELKKLLKMLGI